jgi:hypothetical protein
MEESIMVMEHARPRLKALAKLAPQLNEATDRYMAELKAIEAELRQMNLGVEVELEDSLKETDWEEGAENDQGDMEPDFFQVWHLGYGKDRTGDWCLLVRHYKVVQGEYANTQLRTLLNTTPLLNASRDLRLAAAEQIPTLLGGIEKAVKEKLGTLEKVSDKS